MPSNNNHDSPWFLMPFEIIWKVLSLITAHTGRLTSGLFGTIFIVCGIKLAFMQAVAPLGIPAIIFGMLLFLRSIIS